ncbi:MAG: hypothetical protein WBE40_00845 [Thermoplasmata archaeon]
MNSEGGDGIPHLIATRDGDPWEEWEITLLIAQCPANQDYDSRRPWVIELADLIGRTPSSVSMHLGNVWSAKDGKGLPHAAGLIKVVYQRFRGQEDALLAAAAAIRTDLYKVVPSPRVEFRLPIVSVGVPVDLDARRDAEMDLPEGEYEVALRNLEKNARVLFPSAEVPDGSVVAYRRFGSLWCGLLIVAQLAITYPDVARWLVEEARRILGATAQQTKSAESVVDGTQIAIADRVIAERLPKFHFELLSEHDRVTFAARLSLLKSMRSWNPSAERLELFVKENGDAERARVGKYLGIDASRLRNRDTMMLQELVADGLKRGVL